MLDIKGEHDVTSGHLEPGSHTDHLCFSLPAGHSVVDRGEALLGLSCHFNSKQMVSFLLLLSLLKSVEPVCHHYLMV